MYYYLIDDTIESYWALTDKKNHKQGQKLWFSAIVLLVYGNAIAQNEIYEPWHKNNKPTL